MLRISAFFAGGGSKKARSAKTKYEVLIASKWGYRMEEALWRNDGTLYQTVHTQAGFHDLARVSHMDDSMTHGKLKILAYVRLYAPLWFGIHKGLIRHVI